MVGRPDNEGHWIPKPYENLERKTRVIATPMSSIEYQWPGSAATSIFQYVGMACIH